MCAVLFIFVVILFQVKTIRIINVRIHLRRFHPRAQVINDHPYRVIPPAQDEIASAAAVGLAAEELQRLGDVRALVGHLYEALNVEEHQAVQGRNKRRLSRELI